MQHLLISYNLVCYLAARDKTALVGPYNTVRYGLRNHFITDITLTYRAKVAKSHRVFKFWNKDKNCVICSSRERSQV